MSDTDEAKLPEPHIVENAERIIPQQVIDAWARGGLAVKRGLHLDQSTVIFRIACDGRLIEGRINGKVALASPSPAIRRELSRRREHFPIPAGSDGYIALVEQIAGTYLGYPARERAEAAE